MDGRYRPLEVGTILQQRYSILDTVGGGGLTRIYRAQDLFLNDITRPVALKEFHFNPAMIKSYYASVLETFRQAAGFLMELSHPAIPRILDYFDTGDRAYLVMQYVEGTSLQMMLNRSMPLTVAQVIEWAVQLCEVLDYLHHLDPSPFIFCNTTPANIMIDGQARVWLVDFGLSNLFVHQVLNTNIGPAGYSPPELYMGVINQGTDVYGLGATLHHLLTGADPRLSPPFSFQERSIRAVNPDVPEALEAVVMKAVALVPSDRFQDCAEVKAALEQLR